MLLLASGIVTHPALPTDVSEIAARTLDLTAEYPAAMGYGVLGLTMKALPRQPQRRRRDTGRVSLDASR